MSSTVLTFWDFFWIWWIVVLMGGAAYVKANTQTKEALKALEEQIAILTEEVRALKSDTTSGRPR